MEEKKQFNKNRNKKFYGRKNFHKNKPRRKDPALETVEDIRADMTRIEKEIELEIRDITTLTLG